MKKYALAFFVVVLPFSVFAGTEFYVGTSDHDFKRCTVKVEDLNDSSVKTSAVISYNSKYNYLEEKNLKVVSMIGTYEGDGNELNAKVVNRELLLNGVGEVETFVTYFTDGGALACINLEPAKTKDLNSITKLFKRHGL